MINPDIKAKCEFRIDEIHTLGIVHGPAFCLISKDIAVGTLAGAAFGWYVYEELEQ